MEDNKAPEALHGIANFFNAKLAEHGSTPQGVDLNGEKSQTTRFEQLEKIIGINEHETFSVNDLGCGYGAFFDYMRCRYPNAVYYGYDVSEAMIAEAKVRHAECMNAQYWVSSRVTKEADYTVESGIFNLHFGCSDKVWQAHIEATLDMFYEASRRGFAFNCLTSYSDVEKMRRDLFYADPCRLFDYCKKRYSKNVALLHDYGLYDFTILVRKDM